MEVEIFLGFNVLCGKEKCEWMMIKKKCVSFFMVFCVLWIAKGNTNMKGGLFRFYIPFLNL